MNSTTGFKLCQHPQPVEISKGGKEEKMKQDWRSWLRSLAVEGRGQSQTNKCGHPWAGLWAPATAERSCATLGCFAHLYSASTVWVKAHSGGVFWERKLEAKANTEINTLAWILSGESSSETSSKDFGKRTLQHHTSYRGLVVGSLKGWTGEAELGLLWQNDPTKRICKY